MRAFLLLSLLLLGGCISRQKIMVYIWNSDSIPASFCAKEPQLKDFGFYRVLNNETCDKLGRPRGCEEFLSYCQPEAKDMVSMTSKDFNEILDKTLPEDK